MCELHPREISTRESVTASELSEQLEDDAKRASALQKGQIFKERAKASSLKVLLRKVERWEAYLRRMKREKFINEEYSEEALSFPPAVGGTVAFMYYLL